MNIHTRTTNRARIHLLTEHIYSKQSQPIFWWIDPNLSNGGIRQNGWRFLCVTVVPFMQHN